MNTQDFLKKPVRPLFLHYLLPAIFGTMVTSIYVLGDTIIIGKGIGTTAVAALNIALPIYNIYFGLGLLFGVGGSVLMSIARGRGDTPEADGYFSVSLLLCILSWLVCMVLCTVFMEDLAWLMGGTAETMPYIMDYVPCITWGMGAFFFSAYLQTFVRNDGAPKLAMNAVIAGGVTNIVLDYIFVFPMRLGMFGAALATVLGSVLSVLILLLHFFSKKNSLRFSLKAVTPVFLKNITVNGFASFLLEISAGITIILFNLQILKYVGNTGVSVFGIICNTSLVIMGLCKGINQAAQPIISINHGAGLMERCHRVRGLSVVTSLIVCAFLVLAGIFAPEFFTYIFLNPDAEILALSRTAIPVYFVGFLFLGINMVFICYFQAVMQSGYSLFLCLMRGCILVVGFVYLLPLFLDVTGIWLAFPAAELLTLLLGLFFTRSTSRIERNDSLFPRKRAEEK